METNENDTSEDRLVLSDVELRVLGCLLEKERTTPEYYPLTVNALTNACNQKSNRLPQMNLEEEEVRDALDSLRHKRLAMAFQGADSRVIKFKHTLDSAYTLDRAEMAILAELMLRGPQTVGELRGRGERMHPFAGLEEVEKCLRQLEEYPGEPLVTKLPRRPGQKEQRYTHLFCGPPSEAEMEASSTAPPSAGGGRIAELTAEVKQLRTEVDELKKAFAEFRQQFE